MHTGTSFYGFMAGQAGQGLAWLVSLLFGR
jgi:hypothetical protein